MSIGDLRGGIGARVRADREEDDFISKPSREAELFQKIHTHARVEYVYAKEHLVPSQGEKADLTPESLVGWPQDLIDPIRAAVITADLDQLLARIQEVEAASWRCWRRKATPWT